MVFYFFGYLYCILFFDFTQVVIYYILLETKHGPEVSKMFGRKKQEEPEVIVKPEVKQPAAYVPSRLTTIGKGVVLVGDFITADTLEIKGALKGDVLSEGKIHVAEGGVLNGDAKASDVLVGGEINGNLVISNIAEVSDTGSFQGSLETKKFVTNPGSYFEGKLTMIPDRMKQKEEETEDSSTIEY